jgi:hypothetical protein
MNHARRAVLGDGLFDALIIVDVVTVDQLEVSGAVTLIGDSMAETRFI